MADLRERTIDHLRLFMESPEFEGSRIALDWLIADLSGSRRLDTEYLVDQEILSLREQLANTEKRLAEVTCSLEAERNLRPYKEAVAGDTDTRDNLKRATELNDRLQGTIKELREENERLSHDLDHMAFRNASGDVADEAPEVGAEKLSDEADDLEERFLDEIGAVQPGGDIVELSPVTIAIDREAIPEDGVRVVVNMPEGHPMHAALAERAKTPSKHNRTYETTEEHVVALWHGHGSVTRICQRISHKGLNAAKVRAILDGAGIDHTISHAKAGPKPKGTVVSTERDEFGFNATNRATIIRLRSEGLAPSRICDYLPKGTKTSTVAAFVASLDGDKPAVSPHVTHAPAKEEPTSLTTPNPYHIARPTKAASTLGPQELIQALTLIAEHRYEEAQIDLRIDKDGVSFLVEQHRAKIAEYRALKSPGAQRALKQDWLTEFLEAVPA